jgi:hypothetical protein
MNAVGHKQLLGRTADLPEEVENDLVNHVLKLEERPFGLTRKYLRLLVYEIVMVGVLWAVSLVNLLV